MKRKLSVVAIVDDDALIRDSLGLAIQSHGWAIPRLFPSGGSLLSAINRDEYPDALILDLNLPDMTGVDIQGYLAEIGAPIPVIVLTAAPDGELAKQARDRGAAKVLAKPASYESLTDALQEILSDPSTFAG